MTSVSAGAGPTREQDTNPSNTVQPIASHLESSDNQDEDEPSSTLPSIPSKARDKKLINPPLKTASDSNLLLTSATKQQRRNTSGDLPSCVFNRTDDQRDLILARKMSSVDLDEKQRAREMVKRSSQCEEPPAWRLIGDVEMLRKAKCRRLYAKIGRHKDLALFYKSGNFYALGAWCSHMGGPLFEGDIEDFNGKPHIMCPWHAYMFDLETGRNSIGLQQPSYGLEVREGQVWVEYISQLSLYPFL